MLRSPLPGPADDSVAMRRTLTLLLCVLWALVVLAGPAQAQPRFRESVPATPLALGSEVLTEQERAFIDGLPEVRVVIPLPAARPYEVVSQDGEVSGIHPELLGYLARAFGLRVRPVLVQGWTQALDALRRREADLILSIGYTPERARYLEFTLGLTPLPGALFTRGNRSAGEADLAAGRFVLERNFLAGEYIRRQYPKASVLTVETTGEALRAVAEGRADFYLGSLLAAMDWAGREQVPGIEVNRLLNYGGGHYHFAVRKDWAPLAGVLNKGISTLRSSGVAARAADRGWVEARASMPAGLPMPAPLRLSARELARLSSQPVWRVGAVRGLPLLNHLEPDGVHSGIAAEVTEQVVRRLGVGHEVVGFANVGEMLDALRRGEIDLVPFLTRTPEREREFAFSAPYVEMPYVIVARADAPMYWNLDSLRGKTLALAAQHPLMPLLASRYPDVKRLLVRDGREALDAVADRRADAAVEVKLFANLRINGENDERLRTVAHVDEVPAQFHFATLASGAGLLGLVDRALADIPAEDLLRIQRRWVAVDLSPGFAWRRWAPALATAAAALLALSALTAWWVRRLAREVQARRRSEARLRDIGATVPGVAFRHVFAGEGGAPLAGWISSRAEAVLGAAPTPGRTLVAHLAERLPADEGQSLLQAERQALHAGGRLHRTLALADAGGASRWYTLEAVCTAAERGRLAWTGYLVDTHHEHELRQQLLAQAQARNLALASASHELRAPAHTLSLALQSLHEDGLDDGQRRALRIARDAVSTLGQLLGDVLDAARLDGAPLRLQPQDADLHELLRQVAEGAAAGAAVKGLAFELQIEPGLPVRARLDALRVRQIIVNLVSNALKYTPQGRVELRAGAGPEPGRWRLEVRDTGPGIDEARRSQLFQPFAADARPLAEGSTGLGLVISRRLAEHMGGTLEVDSRPGQGTRALLSLPLETAADAPPPPHRAGPVLVCDDDPTSRLLLAHVLRSRGYAVEEAESAEAALAACRRQRVAAVITDLEMPGLGGRGLLQALQSPEVPGAHRPALLVCSGDTARAADPQQPAWVDARLDKPVDLSQLLDTLARLGVRPAG